MLADTVRGAGDPMESETDKGLNLVQLRRNHTHKGLYAEKRNQIRGRGRRARSRKGITKARGSMLAPRAEVPLSPEKADGDLGHVSGSQRRRWCNIPWRGPA